MKGHYDSIFEYFNEISKIPRGSGNEKAISDYLAAFGTERGLEVVRDKFHNVVIKKPGAANTMKVALSQRGPVVIQGHMDMVCEKNGNTDHDFTKDPIPVRTDGEYIFAEGTTLGADNGIALAIALTLINADDIPHPDLEFLFTADEEAGMTGAFNLDPSAITGRRLLNLDSEEEGVFFTSCAGGMRAMVTIPLEYVKLQSGYATCKIRISGLKGGHSGFDIHHGRANAIRLLCRMFSDLEVKNLEIQVAEISGGMKSNAIPRESEAVVVTSRRDYGAFCAAIEDLRQSFEQEYRNSDPGLCMTVEPVPEPNRVFSNDTLKKIISAVMLIPNGVQAMSKDTPGVVETSNNVGVLRTKDEIVVIDCALRSSVVASKYLLANQLVLIGNLLGANTVLSGDYPAWEFNPYSELRETAVGTFIDLYGREPKVTAIHAGLECGIFAEKIEGLDMLSLGPDVQNAHSPDERMNISSVKRFWDYLVELLKRLINETAMGQELS